MSAPTPPAHVIGTDVDEQGLLEPFRVDRIPSIALAAFHSLVTSGVLVAAGIYLGRAGVMSREVTRGVAELTLRVTMPCLLFTRVIAAMDLELIAFAYPMLLLPLVNCAIGLLLGQLVLLCSPVEPAQRTTILCAVAFGNPLSLPLVLLAVVQDEMFHPAAVERLGSIGDPVVYLSLYQPLAYICMYGLGGWLLGVNFREKTPSSSARLSKQMYIIPNSARSSLMLNGCADGSASASPVQLPPRQLGGNDNVSLLDGAGIRSDDDGSAAERPPLSKAAAAACSGSPWAMRCAGVRTTVIQAMSPPVVAVLLGLVCGAVPPVKRSLWPPETAILGSLVKGMVRLAGAALPVSMLLLGVSISKGPDWTVVNLRTNVCVCLAKMAVTPLLSVALWSLSFHLFGPKWALADTSLPWHVPMALTALTVTAMPTGNTMLMLVELGGGDRAALSTIMFLQYLVSPILLTLSLSGFVIAVTAGFV